MTKLDIRCSPQPNAQNDNPTRITALRAQFERELRKLVTIGCAVASCAFDGDSQTEENEMNAFVAGVLDLIDRTKAKRKRRQKAKIIQLDPGRKA